MNVKIGLGIRTSIWDASHSYFRFLLNSFLQMATFDDMNGQNATKRQRTIHGVHHSLRYRQSIPSATEAASQDPRIIQRQLDKGITTALAFAGFDSVTGSALHSLEALAEECQSTAYLVPELR